MKLSFALVMSLLAFSAFADCNREAQFVGTVTNIKVLPGSFTFQVTATQTPTASAVCPMFEEEVAAAVIEVAGTPSISEGSQISGVLVFDDATQSYKID
jgi:uncharacterized protein (TIGR02588 family)